MIVEVLVWVLIMSHSHAAYESAPMADLESCQRLQKSWQEVSSSAMKYSRCVQVKILMPGRLVDQPRYRKMS